MHFRSDESAPLPQVELQRLPGLDQHDGDESPEGSDTHALRAALREPMADHDKEAAKRVTMPLLVISPSPRKSAKVARRQRQVSRRRMAVMAVALLVLLGMGTPLLGSRFGVLAFDLAANQYTAAPSTIDPSGPQAGVASLDASGTPQSRPSQAPPAPKLPTPTPKPTEPPPSYNPSGPYSSWTPPPGYSSFAVKEPSPDPWANQFGQCTWWAQDQRKDENLVGWGASRNWVAGARSRGYTVSATPAANATVVFQPGVQGASGIGHVAHVIKVLTGGWVLVSEMNFYWNGGGFARVDYRYVHVGSGVMFIY